MSFFVVTLWLTLRSVAVDLSVSLQACGKVTKYVSSTLQQIHTGLDGNNVEAVLRELDIRLHRVICEHLLQYQYNSMGECGHLLQHEYRAIYI